MTTFAYSTTGAVVQEREYDAFGRSVSETTSPGFSQPFGFAGGLWDVDTGLIRFGARDYRPEVDSWASKDPLRFGGGDTSLYAYAANDPVNLVDLNGLMVLPRWDTVMATCQRSYARSASPRAARELRSSIPGGRWEPRGAGPCERHRDLPIGRGVRAQRRASQAKTHRVRSHGGEKNRKALAGHQDGRSAR